MFWHGMLNEGSVASSNEEQGSWRPAASQKVAGNAKGKASQHITSEAKTKQDPAI